MVFILFGLMAAAAVGLVLGLLSPRLVPVPFPATRSLAAGIYAGLLLVGGVPLGILTRESWLPYMPTIAALVTSPLAPVLPKLAETHPMTPKEVSTPVAPPSSTPATSSPLPPPLPDPGPPPEGPTRFGPKSLAQSAAKLRSALDEQGLITEWGQQVGPLGQTIWIGKGVGLGILAEADEDRLYRIQATEDLGIALTNPGPLVQDTVRLQLGLTGLVLATVSLEPEALRRESDQAWQKLLIRLQEDPSSNRFSETLTIAGASLRLTLTQKGKASAQLAASLSDLDPLLDAEP